MLKKPPDCKGCPLQYKGRGFSEPEGTGRNGVLVLLEALGKQEMYRGLPLQGAAGLQFNRILRRTEYNRDDFVIWNTVACKPPNNWLDGAPWERGAVNHCSRYLKRVLQHFKPRVILAMGAVATRHLLNLEGLLDSHAPKRGYVYDYSTWLPNGQPFSAYVVPTMHPAFIMYGNQKLVPTALADIQRAIDVAKSGWQPDRPACITHPTTAQLQQYYEKAASTLGWIASDIETPRSDQFSEEDLARELVEEQKIDRVSFAFEADEGITVPFKGEYVEFIKAMFSLRPEYFLFWNADFDRPRLEKNGIVFGADVLDAMWLWHWYQTALPRGLAYATTFFTKLNEWKSLSGSKPEYYSCIDSIACWRVAVECKRLMQEQNRWDTFIRQHQRLDPILKEMGNSGVLIDKDAQQAFREIMVDQKNKANELLQREIPTEVRLTKPYARPPIEFRCPECKGNGRIKKVRSKNKVKYLEYLDCETCDNLGYLPEQIPDEKTLGEHTGRYELIDGVWHWVREFLPGSSDEVKRLILLFSPDCPNCVIKKHYKTGSDTTGADELEALIRNHRLDKTKKREEHNQLAAKLFQAVLDVRQADKMISTYIDGYPIDDDGCVRTNFGQKPSTLRLNSWNPNVQNIRKRWVLAKEYRKQFVPRPGHLLCESDFSAIEAVFTGVLAEDADYIRAAKHSVHAIMASHVLVEQKEWKEPINLSWSDEDIAEAVQEIKAKYDYDYRAPYAVCKVVVHASNYNPTPAFKLFKTYPEVFGSVAGAQRYVDFYFDTLGKKIHQWQYSLLWKTQTDGWLDTPLGYRFYFNDVIQADGSGKKEYILLQQAKDVLAAGPQSMCAWKMKETILGVAETQYRSAMRWTVHDSLLYELPKESLEQGVAAVESIMKEPIVQLDNLVIGVETKWSDKSWGEM